MPGATNEEPFRSEVIRRVEARLDEMVDVMWGAIARDIAPYRDLTPVTAVEEVRSAVHAIASLFLRRLKEGTGLTAAEVEQLVAIGAQRADQGIPVESVSKSVQLAVRLGHQQLLAAATELPASTTRMRAVGEMSLALLDLSQEALVALAAGHAQRREATAVCRLQARTSFVHDLIEEERDQDEQETRRRTNAAGIYLGPPCGLLIVIPRHSDLVRLRRAMTFLLEAVPASVEGPIRFAPALHAVILAPARTAEAWVAICRSVDNVGVHEDLMVLAPEPVTLLGAVGRSYRDARDYVELLCHSVAPSGVVVGRQLALARVMTTIPAAKRHAFIQETYGPILELPSHKCLPLLETVGALYDCEGRLGDAATQLDLHVKGVRYRLGRVTALTGLRFDVPAERLRLDLALQLHRLGEQFPIGAGRRR